MFLFHRDHLNKVLCKQPLMKKSPFHSTICCFVPYFQFPLLIAHSPSSQKQWLVPCLLSSTQRKTHIQYYRTGYLHPCRSEHSSSIAPTMAQTIALSTPARAVPNLQRFLALPMLCSTVWSYPAPQRPEQHLIVPLSSKAAAVAMLFSIFLPDWIVLKTASRAGLW